MIPLPDLIAELESLRKPHHVSPDCWYTCPAMNRLESNAGPGERCCNSVADNGSTECTCGAEEFNAKIDALIERLRA